MLEILFKPFNILFDNTKKLSVRIIYLATVLMTIILINDYTGFLFNLKTTYQLEQIKIIKDLGVESPDLNAKALDISNQVLQRKTMIEKLTDLYINADFDNNNSFINIPSINWRNVTASSFFILAMIIMLFVPFFNGKKGGLLTLIVGIVIVEFIFGLFAWGMIKLLSLVPSFDNGNWNHLINISANLLIILLITIFSKSNKKSNSIPT